MAARSSFGREKQLQVQDACRRLVRGVLQENATSSNIAAAQAWCLHRLREHQYSDTNPGQVASSFQQLLEKFRVHSQLEAADYIADMHSAFFKCRLSRRYTDEAHAGVLRALLLLADRPVDVPLRTIRDLRRIAERRRSSEVQQRRGANEQAHERLALLKMELRQIGEEASREWDEAWATPELLPFEGAVASAQAVEVELPAEQSSAATAPGVPVATQAARTRTREGPARAFPRGILPRPSWQQLHRLPAGAAVVVSEKVVVQMSLQMLAGYPGELMDQASDGKLSWLPLKMLHYSEEALSGLLQPLAVLGTALHRLRALASVLEDVGLPLADKRLCQEVSRAAQDRSFGLREVTILQGAVPLDCGVLRSHDSTQAVEVDILSAAIVFGLCWQSFGLALQDLLQDLTGELHELQAALSTACEVASAAGRRSGSAPAVLTLLQLERWAEPHRCTVTAVAEIVDAILEQVRLRCAERHAKLWPEASAEELLTELSRALQGDQLLRRGLDSGLGTWLVRLWNGAARPVLRAMDQWAATGELHDPCGEFPGITGKAGSEPALLPRLVTSGGRHARSLRNWAEASGGERAARRREEASVELGSIHMLAHEQGIDWAAKRCVPLEASLEALALQPARRLAHAVTKPFFLHVLLDPSHGLLAHLAALRLVVFLEREEVASPLTSRLFEHVRRHTPLGSAQDSMVMDMNATLAESLDCAAHDAKLPTTHIGTAKQLCARHLMISVVDDGSQGEGFLLDCLRVRYAAPAPLDAVLSEGSLGVYSALMVLLLRVRHAQSMLLGLHNLPLFGFSNRSRRTWQGNMTVMPQPLALLANLAHECDLMRAKFAHFLGCLERHLRVDVIADATRSLDKQLLQMAEAGPLQVQSAGDLQPGDFLADGHSCGEAKLEAFDAVERACRLHTGYLQRLQQECFLAPELRSVLADLEHLVGLAPQLHNVLEDLLRNLQPDEQAPSTPVIRDTSDMLSVSTQPAEMDEDALDLDSHEAAHALATATVQAARIKREFQNGASFLHQALMYSVARGTRHRVADLCLQMNFNNYYHQDVQDE